MYQYPIPGSTSVQNAFTANNTGVLGDIDQTAEAKSRVMVDYSQLNPAVTLTGYSFRVRPGGSPQLWVSGSTLGAAPATMLTFMVGGGIRGVQYTLSIDAMLNTGEVRTDVINVSIAGDDCGCQLFVNQPPAAGSSVSPDGSLVYNNTGPRFFVSSTPPVGANVLDRWYNTTTGIVYDYITNGATSSWQAADSGGGGGGGGVSNVTPIGQIYPDGVSTSFNLVAADGASVNITDPNTLFISQDGVWQQANVSYSIANGNILSFTVPPSADSVVFMVWFAPAVIPPLVGG